MAIFEADQQTMLTIVITFIRVLEILTPLKLSIKVTIAEVGGLNHYLWPHFVGANSKCWSSVDFAGTDDDSAKVQFLRARTFRPQLQSIATRADQVENSAPNATSWCSTAVCCVMAYFQLASRPNSNSSSEPVAKFATDFATLGVFGEFLRSRADLDFQACAR